MRNEQANRLTQLAIEKYAQPGETAAQQAEAGKGFHLCEQRLIQQHCKPGAATLVIGCGAGREAFAFASAGYPTYAADLNYALLDAAYHFAKKPAPSFVNQDACRLGFKSNCMQQVTMLAQMISMIPGTTRRRTALAEAYRVLKPGGVLLLSTHNRRYKWTYSAYFTAINALRKAGRFLGMQVLEDNDYMGRVASDAFTKMKYYRHIYDHDEMCGELVGAGFHILETASREELNADIRDTALRQRDYLIFYAAQKK